MNADILSQTGSMLSTCVNWPRRQRTVQVSWVFTQAAGWVSSPEQIDFSPQRSQLFKLKRICASPGAEQASTTLRAHVQVAQAQVDEARRLSEGANKKLAETKVEEIQRMAEYAAFQNSNEEPELHEAYLRED